MIGQWKDEDYFEVAVYWPREAEYGGSETFATLHEAIVAAERLRNMGHYKNVHIRRVTVRVIQSGVA